MFSYLLGDIEMKAITKSISCFVALLIFVPTVAFSCWGDLFTSENEDGDGISDMIPRPGDTDVPEIINGMGDYSKRPGKWEPPPGIIEPPPVKERP